MILLSGMTDSAIYTAFGLLVAFSVFVFVVPAIFLRKKINGISKGSVFVKIALYVLSYFLSNTIAFSLIWFVQWFNE
jgi:hypothetical protein